MSDQPIDHVPIKDIHCPQCGEKLGIELVTKLMSDSRMSFTLTPNPGELLSAKTVGKSIAEIENLLVAVGKELGARTNVLIEGLTFKDGAVTVNLLLARHDAGIKERKSAA